MRNHLQEHPYGDAVPYRTLYRLALMSGKAYGKAPYGRPSRTHPLRLTEALTKNSYVALRRGVGLTGTLMEGFRGRPFISTLTGRALTSTRTPIQEDPIQEAPYVRELLRETLVRHPYGNILYRVARTPLTRRLFTGSPY